MQGHNIVADGWAGASNPHPDPTPINRASKCLLAHLLTHVQGPMDQRTDQQTDGQTKALIEMSVRNKKVKFDRRTDKLTDGQMDGQNGL